MWSERVEMEVGLGKGIDSKVGTKYASELTGKCKRAKVKKVHGFMGRALG